MTPARLLAAAALTAAVGGCGTPTDPRLPVAPTRSPERRDLRAADRPRPVHARTLELPPMTQSPVSARQAKRVRDRYAALTSSTDTGPARQPAWTPERARASALVALRAFCRTAPPDPRCSGTQVDERVAFAPSTHK